MNRTRLPAKLTSLARRDRVRLIREATEAAATPEIKALAKELSDDVRLLGPGVSLEILMQIGLLLERRHRV